MPTAIDPGLFTWPSDTPHLLGSRCEACGATTFPQAPSCSRCASVDMATVELPDHGTLWTFTIQGFPPKKPPYAGPDPFVPYGVGYVDLGEVKVESRLTVNDPERLRIGMPMQLVVEPFVDDVVTFAFAPVEG